MDSLGFKSSWGISRARTLRLIYPRTSAEHNDKRLGDLVEIVNIISEKRHDRMDVV